MYSSNFPNIVTINVKVCRIVREFRLYCLATVDYD